MLFSIIIPAYNCFGYLESCINSVFSQSFDDYEIILVNDGSNDGTASLCDKFAKYDRVSVIHEMNGGASRARNIGIDLAAGEYIVFLDSDDEFADGYLEGIAKHIATNSCDLLLGSLRTDFGDGASERNVRLFDVAQANAQDLRGLVRYFFTSADDAPFAAWHNVYSRIFLTENGLRFNERLIWSEDRDFVLRVLRARPSWKCISVPGYRHRIEVESSVTGRVSVDKILRAMDCDEEWLRISAASVLFSCAAPFFAGDLVGLTLRAFELPANESDKVLIRAMKLQPYFAYAVGGQVYCWLLDHDANPFLLKLVGKTVAKVTSFCRKHS